MDQNEVGPALVQQGYKYIGGWGPTATWESPASADGKTPPQRYSEYSLANALWGDISPYAPQKAASQSASGQGANAPDITYDAQGNAFTWHNGQSVAQPWLNNPTKAAGYQPPRAPVAPLQAQIQVAQNGDVVRIDPYSGTPSIVGNIPSLAQHPNLQTYTGFDGRLWTIDPQSGQTTSTGIQVAYSPDELRQQQQADATRNEQFTAGQNTQQQKATAAEGQANRTATAAENAAQRGFTGTQNDLTRAEQAAEFAANYGLQSSTAQNNYNQYVAGFQQQQQKDKLAAAAQYATEVSLVDPAALPAFYQAGGGNIMNAIHNGGTALSDNAVLPAAQTLRTIQSPWAQPAPYVQPPGFTPPATPALTGQQVYPPQVPPPPQFTSQTAPTQIGTALVNPNATGGGAPATPTQAPQNPAGSYAPGWTPGPQWSPTPGFATGGFTDARTFIAGDPQRAGTPNPEVIHLAIRNGQPVASVTPMHGFGSLPAYADGTMQGANPSPFMQEGDQPYVDQVRQFRQSVDTTPPIAGGYMNASWGNVAPSLQQRYYQGFQDAYGVPSSDVSAQANQYGLVGLRRQPVYGLVAQPSY